MQLSAASRGSAFAHWLRTGRLPSGDAAQRIELKFNPYHDPRNGQFTFAPGGPAATRRADTARPLRSTANFGPSRPGPAMGRGSNSRAFEKPMTLEQVFPGLRNAPGGAIIAVADDFFDIFGPGNAVQMELAANWSRQLKEQIKQLDPNWHYDQLGPNDTVEGKYNELNDLRFKLAALTLQKKGDPRQLQVEAIRFLQSRVDAAYVHGTALLKAGKLTTRLSPEEALGTYIDQRVRKELRDRYNEFGIDSAGRGPVRVNRREYDTSGVDSTYYQPDSRIDKLALDVTLTRKTSEPDPKLS